MIDEMKPQRNARRREPTPPNVGVAKKTVRILALIYF